MIALLRRIMGPGRLIRKLDTTVLKDHERAVQALTSMGRQAVPSILHELSQEPDEERSPSVVAARQGGVADHVIAGGIYAGSPVPADVSSERILHVTVARGLIAIGKNRQYGLCLALGHIGDERAVPVLTERLSDKSRHVASAAAEALIRIGSDAALRAVLPSVEKDSSLRWHLRVMAGVEELLEGRSGQLAHDVLEAVRK